MGNRLIKLLLAFLLISVPVQAQTVITPVAGVATVDTSTCPGPGTPCAFQITMTGSVTLNIINGRGTVDLFFTNVGSFTLTWPATVVSPPTVASNGTTLVSLKFNNTLGQWYVTAGGGVSSPSSLTAFFSGYQGLSPFDCGNAACTQQDLTAGNGRQTQDGVLTSGSAVVTSATAGFCNAGSVSCGGLESNSQPKTSDVGRQFEAVCGTSSVGALTVASVQSATQITLSATQSTCNAGSLQIFIGSDNTQTLQNWVAAGLANHAIHSYFLPKGVYYTTKPLRFVNANAASECSGVVNPTSGFVFCGLGLLGAGAGEALIHPATQPNFLWNTGSTTINGIVFVSNFSFGIIQGVAVVGDTIGYAATGMAAASTVGGFVIGTGVSHFYINQNWFNAINITDGNPTVRGGMVDTGCFECKITANAIEANGADAELFISGLAEKETYDDNFLENAASFPTTGSPLIIGGTNVKQAMFRNFHIKGPNNNSAAIVFQPGFTIATGYTVEFDGGRMDQGGTTDIGVWVRACTGGAIEFNNFNFVNSNNNASVRLMRIDNGPTTCPVVLNGGVMSPGGASSIAVLNNGTGGVWLQGVNCLNGCGLSGTGTTNQFIQQANGWGGLGGITGTFFASNQGTAFATGSVGLTTGWGTSTVTAASGFNQHFRFTISVAGTITANPTITITMPNALPSSTVLCSLSDNGGNNPFISTILQTTQSATAPIFTITGTPTAGDTLTLEGICGP